MKKEFSKSIRYITLVFKKAFENVLSQGEGGVSIHFRYPGQLLTDLTADEFIWKNASEKEGFKMFKLSSTEILRRRNKWNSECLSDNMSYDDVKLMQMIQNVGCKALYHNLDNDIPICKRSEELATFAAVKVENVKTPPPCEEYPQQSFKLLKVFSR